MAGERTPMNLGNPLLRQRKLFADLLDRLVLEVMLGDHARFFVRRSREPGLCKEQAESDERSRDGFV